MITPAIAYIKDQNIDVANKPVYEFGVYTGSTIKQLLRELNNYTLPEPSAIYGFDSFNGLPKDNDPHNYPEWQEGVFDSRKFFGQDDIEAVCRKIQEIARFPNLYLIPGFWDKSLTDDLIGIYQMKPASYIHIDCDLYTSAYLALDFMFRNNLVGQNTLIGYDDWGGTLVTSAEGEAGESRAHKEICEKYKVDCREVYRTGNPPHVQTLFLINSYEIYSIKR